jgi:hypothetical protein
MTTLVCSKKDIWIMFWIDERRMIISRPFHFETRATDFAAVSRAVESDVEALEAVDEGTEQAPTRSF